MTLSVFLLNSHINWYVHKNPALIPDSFFLSDCLDAWSAVKSTKYRDDQPWFIATIMTAIFPAENNLFTVIAILSNKKWITRCTIHKPFHRIFWSGKVWLLLLVELSIALSNEHMYIYEASSQILDSVNIFRTNKIKWKWLNYFQHTPDEPFHFTSKNKKTVQYYFQNHFKLFPT